MPAAETLAYYTAHGVMTDPRDQATLLDGLSADLLGLSQVVQGLLIPPTEIELYEVDLSKVQRKEVNIRPVAELLRQVNKLDPRPLTEARPAGERLPGNCRDHAVLLCAMLRHQGRAARVRVGFATYLGADLKHDHWICEVWEEAESRWRQVDAQIDAIQRKKNAIDFDTLDLPAGKFITAAQTWALCRANKAKSGTFGRNRKLRGWKFIRASLLLELAALNKIELLLWDLWWDLATCEEDQLALQDRKLLDQVAAQINGLDGSFDDVIALFEADPRLGTPVLSKLKLLGLASEPGERSAAADQAAAQPSGANAAMLALLPPTVSDWPP